MAETYDVHYIAHNIGLTAGTTMTPLFKNVTANGCITILDANAWGSDGTVTANLIYCDPTGGTVGGTIATLGSAAQIYAAAGTAQVMINGAVTTALVEPNKVVAVELLDGTAPGSLVIEVAYVKGQSN
jgi:hypothetical protein